MKLDVDVELRSLKLNEIILQLWLFILAPFRVYKVC